MPDIDTTGVTVRPSGKSKNNSTAKKVRILVTAGPTIEPLDPVRFISNRSTGTMGYEIAAKAVEKGYEVILVSGPVTLNPPLGVIFEKVETAEEMRVRVSKWAGKSRCLIMAAAVCDYRPEKPEKKKIKKKDDLELRLIRTRDILAELAGEQDLIKIGFALETDKDIYNGRAKLKKKGLDLIIVNSVTVDNDPFGPEKAVEGRRYVILNRKGQVMEITGVTKKDMAGLIVSEMEKLM